MAGMEAEGRVKQADLELTVVRADGTRVLLGTVASSRRWFNYGPGRLLASWRIRRANRQVT